MKPQEAVNVSVSPTSPAQWKKDNYQLMAEPMGLINLVHFTSKGASTEILTNAGSRVDLPGNTMHFYVGVTPAVFFRYKI